ncbi:MAG: hypothetical protein WC966_04105 [Bradymonadales bacterium]
MGRELRTSLNFAVLLAAFIFGVSAWAQNYVESELSIRGGLSLESGARIMDPVVGDWNGDGIDDIAFGAVGFGLDERSDAGAVYVILGSSSRDWSQSIDTSLLSSFDYRFDGSASKGLLGLSLAFADLNGDGKADLIMAEPGNNGSVYIAYGGKELERGVYWVDDPRVSDVKYYTNTRGSLLGAKLCTGDFDNDGLVDLALASLSLDSSANITSSDITIISSRREWPDRVYNINDKLYGKTRLSRPMSSNVRALYSCAVGDFNDDHLNDIALGLELESYQRQEASGSVIIVYNPTKYSGSVVNLLEKEQNWGLQLFGDQANARLGRTVISGDFTGNGRTDLIISEPGRLIRGPKSEGRLVLLEGGKFPEHSGILEQGQYIVGSGENFASQLQGLDINGDGRPDIVIGQAEVDSHTGARSGKVLVYFGGPHLSESIAARRSPDIILGGLEFSRLGFGSAVGDIDGDKKKDWIIRAGSDPMQRPATGSLAIVRDTRSLEVQASLAEPNAMILGPVQGGGLSGDAKVVELGSSKYTAWLSSKGLAKRSVICLVHSDSAISHDLSQPQTCDLAFVGPEEVDIRSFDFGDINNDGQLELILGMPSYEWEQGIGVVAALTLPQDFNKVLALNFDWSQLKKNAWTFVLEREVYSAFGEKVELRDIDGDGVDELVIGASQRVIDNERSGSVFVVKGIKDRARERYNLASSKYKQFVGTGNEELGSDWAIIDFNLDGELDIVLLGEKYTNPKRENYATAYVLFSPAKLAEKTYNVNSPQIPCLRIIAPKPLAGLKIVSASEDLNGDGSPDLALLSPQFRSGLLRAGIVYGLYADGRHQAGELKLESEKLSDFKFKPARNDRIIDARFALIGGETKLLLATQSMLDSSRGFNAYVFSSPKDKIWRGTYGFHDLKQQKIRLSKSDFIRFIVFKRHELHKQNDVVWLLHPEDGELRSGEGVARELKVE